MKRKVNIGGVLIGDGERIAVQSMTNTPTVDVEQTLVQIEELIKEGCDIVRVAVPDIKSALCLKEIKKRCGIPLVADVHFDYRLAVASIEQGADKVRVNPGNLGDTDKLRIVADCVKANGKALRIGVNGGSLSKVAMEKTGNKTLAMLWSMREYVEVCQSRGLDNLVLAVKCSDVKETVLVNRMIYDEFDYPLHLGVTEAGVPPVGEYKSAIGIGALLLDGIGDTIRVSLTDDPVNEVVSAKNILRALDLYDGVNVVSCPTCARTGINVIEYARKISEYTQNIKKKMKIAVMGCVVNGPGEASDADLGIAGGKDCAVIFKKGKVYKKVENNILEEFLKELDLTINAENT